MVLQSVGLVHHHVVPLDVVQDGGVLQDQLVGGDQYLQTEGNSLQDTCKTPSGTSVTPLQDPCKKLYEHPFNTPAIHLQRHPCKIPDHPCQASVKPFS